MTIISMGEMPHTLCIRGIASETILGEPILVHTGQVNSVAVLVVSLDNSFFASVSGDRTVRLRD